MATRRGGLAHGSLWKAFFAVPVLGVLALLCWASRASADVEFCPLGAAAGQCASPIGINNLRGLAVDYETGHFYVADKNNNRVNVFGESGAFLFAFGWGVDTGAAELQSCTTASTCQAGIAGAGSGQFDHPTKVAVDNDAASASHHDVYVVDGVNSRVEKFDPAGEVGAFVWMAGKEVDKVDNGDLCTKAEAHTCGAGAESEAEGGFSEGVSVGVGSGGVLHVLDNLPLPGNKYKHRLQRFKPSGELVPSQCIFHEGGLATALAVETDGGFWVANQGEGEAIRKYDSSCGQLLEKEKDVETNEMAFDPAGDLFVTQRELGVNPPVHEFRMVTAYEPGGGYLRRFAYDKISLAAKPEGLAVQSGGEGGIFLALPDVGSVIHRLNYPTATHILPSPGPIAVPSSVEVPPAKIGSAKATAIAEVNPEGKATQVHTDYVDEATYLKDIGELGAGHGFDHAKSTAPEPLGVEGFRLGGAEALIGCPNPAGEVGVPGKGCLQPETKYRFRVVATNADGSGEGAVEGPPFKTRKSPEFGDTYATDVGTDGAKLHAEVNPVGVPATGWFEYVDDAQFQAGGFAGATKVPDVGAGQAPLDFGSGEEPFSRAVSIFPLQPGGTYHYRIVADNAQIIEPVASDPEVLRTLEAAPVEPCPANEAARIGPGALLPDCRAYEMVSPLDKAGADIRVLLTSLGLAVIEQSSDSGEKLAFGAYRSFGDAESAPETSQYIARRIEGQEWETHAINSPRGRPIFGAVGQTDTEFKAFSADLCETWQTTFAEPPLGEGAVAGFSNLYRRSDRLCGPEGYEALAPLTTLSVKPESFFPVLMGVSGDGSHAIFTSNAKLAAAGKNGQRQLYESVRSEGLHFVCILPGGKAVSGSCTAGSSDGGGFPGARSGVISDDGQRIFWSSPGEGEGKLYLRIGGTQTVAVSKKAEELAGTSESWFWGAAADGSRAIFTTGGGTFGEGGLYSFDVDSEATTLIAEGALGVMGISNDAKRVYFASKKILAPGATEGKPNLYLYDDSGVVPSTSFVAALANEDLTTAASKDRYATHTARVSPDGAHAVFASVAPLTGYDNKGAEGGPASKEIYRYDANTQKLICVSCDPSGARPTGPAAIPASETSMHTARALADDGRRVYFESPDRLVARDLNGRVDVYQWEEAEAGGCDGADADFVVSAEGCIELVSSGQSSLDSRFVEASPDGHDVFFATLSGLLPQDYGLVDIYDARVNGGLPIPPPPGPVCEGDACQNPPPPPRQATPSSRTYHGPKEASGRPKKGRCAKGRARRALARKGKAHCAPKRKRAHHHKGAAR